MLQRLNLGIISLISASLIRLRFKQENFMSRCCINFTLQLMQLKHISDPSVFKATNNAKKIRLNNSYRFLYMQHISDNHLSISQIICSNIIFHLSTHAKLLLSSIFTQCVLCRISFVGYLYVSGSGPITSVGEERAKLIAIIYL